MFYKCIVTKRPYIQFKRTFTLLNKLHSSFSSLVDKIQRNQDDFEIISMIGKGSTSRVYLGYDILLQKKVILKLFKDIPHEKIEREIKVNNILKDSHCPNIINFIGFSKSQGCQSYTLIFQFLEGGIPLNYFVNNPHLRKTLLPKTCFEICFQVLEALKIIHEQNMIHRDIKPANILIANHQNIRKQQFGKLNNPSKRANLFDFGLTIIKDQHRKNNKFGTNCYKPPQTIFYKNDYDEKLDVWGIGIILAQLLSKKQRVLPFRSQFSMMQQVIDLCGYSDEMIPHQLADRFTRNNQVNWKKLLPEVPEDTVQLIRKMINIDLKKRPSAQEILNDSAFLKNLKN